jgi:hypothetical protein
MEDRVMRILILLCSFLAAGASSSQAVTPAEVLRKTIEERCAKVPEISMAGVFCYTPKGSGSFADEIFFRFDRPTRQIIITFSGRPVLFIRNNHIYLMLSEPASFEEGIFTYLEIKHDKAIRWKDLDSALRLKEKECEAYASGVLNYYGDIKEILAPLIAPFLEGGLDYLIPANATPLPYDPQLMASNPEKAATMIKAKTELASYIFYLGHPDSMFMASILEKSKPLAPEKFPLCFEVDRNSSILTYAFNKENGVFLAIGGLVDIGTSGREGGAFAKMVVLKKDGEIKPASFSLPKNTKIIGPDDLPSFYRQILAQYDLKEVLKKNKDEERELKKMTEKEAAIAVKLAKISADSHANQKQRKEIQEELQRAHDKKVHCAYTCSVYQKLIDAIERQKQEKGIKKGPHH